MTQALLPFTDKRVGVEYEAKFIRENPIQTVCLKCKRREPINAPVLDNVRCFYCWSKLMPVDVKAYQARLMELPRHIVAEHYEWEAKAGD